MARAFSADLRERVVASVVREGMSRRATAARFGVGISTVIGWVRRFTVTGSTTPDRQGGHRPKKIIGAHRDWLIKRCAEKDFTLRGLVAELSDRGLTVDYRAVWKFIHAEKLSHKKRR